MDQDFFPRRIAPSPAPEVELNAQALRRLAQNLGYRALLEDLEGRPRSSQRLRNVTRQLSALSALADRRSKDGHGETSLK